MSTETLPHQIDRTALVSGPPGMSNEAHGAEMPEAWLDWFHRAMSALVAVGPPPPGITPPLAGTIPHLVPKLTLPAQGEVTPDVPPYHIDASNDLGDPQDRLELIRAAFDYARANLALDEQATTRSEADRSNSLVDDRLGALANPSGINLASTTYAPGDLHVTIPRQLDPSPTPHSDGPHSPPTPSVDVVLTTDADARAPLARRRIEDAVMPNRPQDALPNGGTLPSAMGTAEHQDGASFSGNREAGEDNAMVARASSTLQQSALSAASTTQDIAAYDPHALQRQEEQRRKVWEDKKRVWLSKDVTPTRGEDGATGHPSRVPKTRRQASPAPALLKRMTDPRPNACSYSSERKASQPPLTPTHSPRDRSPTPSTPPPSECAGLPLIERLRPIPLVSRIGPYADEPGSAAYFAQANKHGHSSSLTGGTESRVGQSNSASASGRANGETHGRRTARAQTYLEPSSTLSRDTGLPQALAIRKAEAAPTGATSSRMAPTDSRRVASTSSWTVASAGEGARNSEHRLAGASQRPTTLASAAPSSTALKTKEETMSMVGVDEGRASCDALPDAMSVDDPLEPTKAVNPLLAAVTVAPQGVAPTPPSTSSSKVDNRVSSNNLGHLPPSTESASSSTKAQSPSALACHDLGTGTTEMQPQVSPRRSYEQIATELLSSTVPLDRSHSMRAQELAPAEPRSSVLSAPPVASATPISTLPNVSSASEPTDMTMVPLSPRPKLDSSSTSSSPFNGSSSPPIDPADLGEYIFGLPVDNPAPVPELDAPIEQTMEIEQDGEADQLVKTDEQSYGPWKVDEDEVDEPMKMDGHTTEPVKMEEDTDEIKEEEDPAVKTENELAPKVEDVKDEMLVPAELAPRYEPRALIPKSRQRSSASPSVGPSSSSSGQTNGQPFWIEMPSRAFPHGDYHPMSPDEPQPIAQHQFVDLSPEQPLRRSPRTTRSVYRRVPTAKAASPTAPASAPASKPSASAKSVTQSPSSNAPTTQSSAITVQSLSIAAQSSPAAAPSSSTFVQPPSAAARPSPASASHLATPLVSTLVASLGRTYRIPAPSDDEEEGTRVAPILKLRRMNDDHPLERPAKRVRWA